MDIEVNNTQNSETLQNSKEQNNEAQISESHKTDTNNTNPNSDLTSINEEVTNKKRKIDELESTDADLVVDLEKCNTLLQRVSKALQSRGYLLLCLSINYA